MDTLTAHTPSSLYQTFAPAEARRILQKLELHYTEVTWELVEYGRD